MSTRRTVRSPAQAAPRSFTSRTSLPKLVPFIGLVMIERTGIDSRSLKFFSSVRSPGTIGLRATRYEVPPTPAGNVRQRLPVHGKDDQIVRIERLLDGDATRNRILAGVGEAVVGTVVSGDAGGWFDPRCLEHVGEPHAGPLGAADTAVGPLVAARLRRKERAAVAAAFEHQAPRDRPKLGFQLGEGQFELLLHLAVDDDLPGIGVLGRLRHLAVVADE